MILIPDRRRRVFALNVAIWVASTVLLYDEWQRRRRA